MKTLRNITAYSVLVISNVVQEATPDIGTLGASLSSDGKRANLLWTSSPGQLQQIQVSPDLRHWTNLPPIYLSAFANSAWSDDGSLTGSALGPQDRFYRLQKAQTAS